MKKLLLVVLLLSFSAGAFAQQAYVGRYDVFTGFSYLRAEKLDLQQRGFNIQLGTNYNRWLAMGFDYSIQEGRAALISPDLKPNLEALVNQTLAAAQAGLIPGFPAAAVKPPYNLYVPFDATTQTFTAGPQLTYRHFKKLTLFGHPSIGAIHENISLNPHDPFTSSVLVPGLKQKGVLKTTKPNDTTYFYGAGGGFDYQVTKHFKLRTDVEYVHVFLYSNLMASARNSLRVSVGPAFSFGKDVAGKLR
jgi:opacity protein-like surface antigen